MGRALGCVFSLGAIFIATTVVQAAAPLKLGHSILRQPATGDGAALAGFGTDVLERFVSAMRRYRKSEVRHGARSDMPFQPAGGQADVEPWAWSAANGNRVRRLDNGAFRISGGSPADNWFVEFVCEVAEWPKLTCDDGRSRRMLVVDVNTIEVDGVRYRREILAAE